MKSDFEINSKLSRDWNIKRNSFKTGEFVLSVFHREEIVRFKCSQLLVESLRETKWFSTEGDFNGEEGILKRTIDIIVNQGWFFVDCIEFLY